MAIEINLGKAENLIQRACRRNRNNTCKSVGAENGQGKGDKIFNA